MPVALNAITGGLYCSGGNNDSTTKSIIAETLGTVASNTTDQTIGHAGFVIVDYPTLSLLTFPDLATVGLDFIIARNPKLTTIEFPSLKSVSGNVDITGNFETLNLPSLSFVGGSFNLKTSSASFICPQFLNVSIHGPYSCSVGVNDPQPLPADNSTTNPTPVNVISVVNSQSSASVSASVRSSSSVSSTSVSPSHTSVSSSSTASSSATPGSITSWVSASSVMIWIIVFVITFTQILNTCWL
jgi:hypothetical protein